MPHPETQSQTASSWMEVLTLTEAAEFLRVPEETVQKLFEDGNLPAQRINGELRILKQSLVDWLRFGSRFPREYWRFSSPWMMDHPFWEDMFRTLEQRILSKLPASEPPSAKPGSKEAVLKHFGIFKDDGDLEEQLASLRAIREAAGK